MESYEIAFDRLEIGWLFVLEVMILSLLGGFER